MGKGRSSGTCGSTSQEVTMTTSKLLVVSVLSLFLAASSPAQSEQPSAYPERGTVTAMTARSVSPGMVLGPNQGITASVSRRGYRIETDKEVYIVSERSRKQTMTLGQMIEFRIAKGYLYTPNVKGKENKYRVIGEQMRSAT